MKTFATSLYRILGDPQLSYPSYGRVLNPDKLTIASILDPLPYNYLKSQSDLFHLSPNSAGEAIENIEPDFLLCESAWRGNHGEWKNRIATNAQPHPALVNAVQAARKQSIPTIFWYTCAATRKELFKGTAELFDVIIARNTDYSQPGAVGELWHQSASTASSAVNLTPSAFQSWNNSEHSKELSLLLQYKERKGRILRDLKDHPPFGQEARPDEMKVGLRPNYAAVVDASSANSLGRLLAEILLQSHRPEVIWLTVGTTTLLGSGTVSETLQSLPDEIVLHAGASPEGLYGVSFSESFKYSASYAETITVSLFNLNNEYFGLIDDKNIEMRGENLTMNSRAMASRSCIKLRQMIDHGQNVPMSPYLNGLEIFEKLALNVQPLQFLDGPECA